MLHQCIKKKHVQKQNIYSICSLRLLYIFALKQASFWYGESCVSVLTRILIEYVECFHTRRDTWLLISKKCTFSWSNHVMRLEQKLHLKKEDCLKKKKTDMETFQTIQTRSGRPMFWEEVRHVFEKHFLVELWGNVWDDLAGDEPIRMLMLPCLCLCVCVCVF